MFGKFGNGLALIAPLFSATLFCTPTIAGNLNQYELTLPKELDCGAVELRPAPLTAVIEAEAVQVYDRDRQLVREPKSFYRWDRGVLIGSHTVRPDRSVDHRKLMATYGPIQPTEHYSLVDILRSLTRIGFETNETEIAFYAEPTAGRFEFFSVITPNPGMGMDGVVGFSLTNMTMVFYYQESTRDLDDIANDRMYMDIPLETIRQHPVYAALTVEDDIVKRAIAFVRIAPEIGETRRRMVRALNALFGNLQSGYGFADFQSAPAWTGLTGWSREELCHLARTYSTSP